MKKNIAIFFGGKSVEHDISIITALQTMKNLDINKFNMYPIYISKTNKWYFDKNLSSIDSFVNFKEDKFKNCILEPSTRNLYTKIRNKYKKIAVIDFAVICCHGKYGEDGCLQGLLEISDIPYSSSSHIASSLGIDKIIMKKLFLANNFPTTDFIWFTKSDYLNNSEFVVKNIENEIGYPVILKPSRLGSSIGISISKNRMELENNIKTVVCYDNRIIAEKALVKFRELNCSVIGNEKHCEISVIEEPKVVHDILNFNDKYVSKANERIIDVKLPRKLEEKIKKLSALLFKEFSCKGVIRIDFLYDKETKNLYVNELNTVPGSLSFYLWKDKKPSGVIDDLIKYSIEDYNEENKLIHSFKSEVVQGYKENSNKQFLKK